MPSPASENKVIAQVHLVVRTRRHISERTQLDRLIFRIETGQEPMPWKEYSLLKAEADELMETQAKLYATMNGCSYKVQLKRQQKLRHRDRMEAMLNRHLELHPEEKDEMEPLIEALRSAENGSDIDPEVLRQFRSKFDYLFASRPQPPAQPSGLFKRYFGS